MAGSLHIMNQGPQGIGANFAAGVGSGIQQLMQQQVQHMQERKGYQKKLKGLKALGLPDAEGLAHLDDATLQQVVKNHLERMGNTQQYNQMYQQPNVDQYAQQPEQQFEQPQEQPQQQYSMLEQLAGAQPPIQSAAQQAMNLGNPRPQFNPGAQQEQTGNPFMPEVPQFKSAAEQAFNLGNWRRPEAPQEPEFSPKTAPEANKLQEQASALSALGPRPQKPNTSGMTNKQKEIAHKQYKEEDERWRDERKFQQAENNKLEQIALKETKSYADGVINKEKAAKSDDLRLKRMEKVIEKGQLPNATLWGFLTKLEDTHAGALAGVGAAAGAALGSVVPGAGTIAAAGAGGVIGGLTGAIISPLAGAAKSLIRSGSPDIEEFEKLSADFVKNAKQIFGARITDADLKAFMATVPNLMQTDAGKKKIIANLRSINEIAKIEADAMRAIIKENNGHRPMDLEQQVQDRISGDLDRLAELFIA